MLQNPSERESLLRPKINIQSEETASSERQHDLPSHYEDEEEPDKYPATSRKLTIQRSLFVAIVLVFLIGIVIVLIAIKKKESTQGSSLLEDIRELYNTPGVSQHFGGIIQDSLAAGLLRNGTLDIQVTGVRKYDDPTLVTKDDLWHLGSCGKAMTTTILAQLIDEGFLSWETTLSEALPWINMSEGHRNTTLATIGAHRAGFSGEWFIETETGKYSDLLMSLYHMSSLEGRELVIDFVLSHPPIFRPGTEYDYSNAGYMILGYVIEKITGRKWADAMEWYIFNPLGMTDCRVGVSLDTSIPPIEPWPHVSNISGVIPIPPDIYGDLPIAMAPAGLTHCSLPSYSKFLQFHIDGYKGRYNTTNITLSETGFKKLHTPWPGHFYTSGGWGVFDIEGVGHVLMHTGSNELNFLKTVIVTDIEAAFFAVTNIGMESGFNATEATVNALYVDRGHH